MKKNNDNEKFILKGGINENVELNNDNYQIDWANSIIEGLGGVNIIVAKNNGSLNSQYQDEMNNLLAQQAINKYEMKSKQNELNTLKQQEEIIKKHSLEIPVRHNLATPFQKPAAFCTSSDFGSLGLGSPCSHGALRNFAKEF